MKHSKKTVVVAVILFCGIVFTNVAHANIVEQILSSPKIQALLGKPAEIASQAQQCKNAAFRQANSQRCTDADNASVANQMPFEMRTLMTNKTSAQALRDLCLAAQSTPQQGNYLCAELAKADKDFSAAAFISRTRARMFQPGEN